jgi:hypothetical protein
LWGAASGTRGRRRGLLPLPVRPWMGHTWARGPRGARCGRRDSVRPASRWAGPEEWATRGARSVAAPVCPRGRGGEGPEGPARWERAEAVRGHARQARPQGTPRRPLGPPPRARAAERVSFGRLCAKHTVDTRGIGTRQRLPARRVTCVERDSRTLRAGGLGPHPGLGVSGASLGNSANGCGGARGRAPRLPLTTG